ncbi:DNA-directed RNA polymerase III subunit RPC2 [Sphaceloma murrayae]|uniref:DNA-directed RNA polymerase subunit beta n=1 Tax=Sphaceloma murrayae TaxID=2082308 RepID=A0A2K1QH59_9PEZI|nr:DNA-directed RNA polymerase III subunit RPC2 [Sphaceloma murrayae]
MESLYQKYYHGKKLTDPINTVKDKWNLLPAFLQVKGLIKQHTDSYNYFVDTELRNILKANSVIHSDVDPKMFIRFTDIRVGKPNRLDDDSWASQQKSGVTPNECRLRDLTYAAPILVDFVYTTPDGLHRTRNVCIGRLPIMLRSSRCVLSEKSHDEMMNLGECPIDPGGYFIVRGQEKVILIQEQLSKNRIIVESAKGIIEASVTSHTANIKTKTYVICKKGEMALRHRSLTEIIPIAIVFRAMGVQSDQEIMELVTGSDNEYQDAFVPNLETAHYHKVFTQSQALHYIGTKIRPTRSFNNAPKLSLHHQALDLLANTVAPHVIVAGTDFRRKAIFMAAMTRRVLMAQQDPSMLDDKDFVGNKRLELAGSMLALLFEDTFKDYCRLVKLNIDKVLRKPNRAAPINLSIHVGMHHFRITQSLDRAISSGNWTLKRFNMDRAGVTHVLSRLCYISALGMMMRISSQFEKTRKVSGPRALQTSQFGMLCPNDTPEGEACGLVKNLALMTHITTADEEMPVRNIIFALGAEEVTMAGGGHLYTEGTYIIFLNGTPTATTRRPQGFLNKFRNLRRVGRIAEFVGIHINHSHRGVHIATDEGRICRPLIVVENGRSRVTQRCLESLRNGNWTFDDFRTRGKVEFLDVNEESDCNIAVSEANIDRFTTHLEIEPFTVLGAVAGLIPYPHHNQSPRNTYQCAMGKQAMGTIGYNQTTRIDTLKNLMVYPQRPLVQTRTIALINFDKLPAGQNATVVVMSFSGYDIEDALVVNKASIQRGFGRCQVFKKTAINLKAYPNGLQDRIGGRDPSNKDQKKLGNDGMIEVGVKMENRDIYILKEVPMTTSSSLNSSAGPGSSLAPQEWAPQHMSYKLPDPSYIDRVQITTDQSNNPLIKIQTRQTRLPEIGDKFSSRHGQKGVVGILAEQVDLPFSDSGIVPDIIMNPHGFPSRMTIGKMLELLSSKAGALRGTIEDGSAFGGSKADDMGQVLIKHGFDYQGKDFLTSGSTGESLPAYVFMGPIYYQKLKHMVMDKMHARSTGPKAILTRQPTEGRSRAGGLRMGEMERDCLVAYGASQLLVERLMISSDKHEVDVCGSCGFMGYKGWCQHCKSSRSVAKMTMPYALKLLVQELLSMNVKASFGLDEEFPRDQE